MSILAISNQKGGSAKTTSSINLAYALTQRCQHVLVIDMDPQGHVAEGFGLAAGELTHEISEVLERKLTLPDIIRTVRPNLDLAPSNIKLSYTESTLFTKARREDRLKHALDPIAGSYDYVIIDCPPSLGILTVNALSAAQHVLIPMAAEYYAMLGVGLLLQSIGEMRAEINPELSVFGILPTRVTHTVNARDILKLTREQLGEETRLFDFGIPETVKFREAAGLGKTIFEHDPESPGASAYARLAEEVLSYGN